MDINKFMKKLVRRLGLTSLKLEAYYPIIKETITEDTLSTFSQFFPYDYIIHKDLSKEKAETAADYSTVYYLSDEFLEKNKLDIISVKSVDGASFFMDYNAPMQRFNVDEMILEGASSNIRSLLNISTKSFVFLPPNRLKLRGYSGTEEVDITVKIPYPSFGNVPESLSESIFKLAMYDVQLVLYPELKHYEDLETADGTISLKISDWADAEQKREDLISEFRNKGFSNSVSKPVTYE